MPIRMLYSLLMFFRRYLLALLVVAGCSRAPASPAVTAAPAQAPADHFVGSQTCAGCHQKAHETWKDTWMARTVRPPSADELKMIESSILCGGLKVDYVLGGRVNLRFLQKRGEGHVFLPCEIEVATKQIKPFHLDDWQTFSFDEKCAACHTTGFDAKTLAYHEPGVGCESCHGPGSRHGDYTKAAGMVQYKSLSAVQEGMICSACHLQGGFSTVSSRRFPENYLPGDDLFKVYTFPWDTLPAHTSQGVTVGTVDPIDVHQKVLMKLQLDGQSDLKCTTCHDVHGAGDQKHQALPKQPYCSQCHYEEAGKFLLKDYQVQCPVCEF